MPNTFIVKVDKDAFLQEVRAMIDPALANQIENEVTFMMKLKYPDDFKPPRLWGTFASLRKLIELVCAAVEITKQKHIKAADAPTGMTAKFDKALALETAVNLVDGLLVFEGWVGAIVEKIDAPILNILISMYVSDRPAAWLGEANRIVAAKK